MKQITGSDALKAEIIKQELERIILLAHRNRHERLLADLPVAEDKPKYGLHAHSVTRPPVTKGYSVGYCSRECVLSHFFQPYAQNIHDPRTLLTFKRGWQIHNHWQQIFSDADVAVSLNDRGPSLDREYIDLHTMMRFSPDAAVRLLDTVYVVEIKGYQFSTYSKLEKGGYPPLEAYKQVQLYMRLTGIRDGFILIECKNDQRFKVFLVTPDDDAVEEAASRLPIITKGARAFLETGELPMPICQSPDDERAQKCEQCVACFGDQLTRERLYLPPNTGWQTTEGLHDVQASQETQAYNPLYH